MRNSDIASSIQAILNKTLSTLSPIGGGSISTAYKAVLSDGSTNFLKVSPQFPDMFFKESNGLRELEKANAIRIPRVLHADNKILILEFLPAVTAANRKKFFEVFGQQFAQMHRFTGQHFGFYEDNYIGSTPQKNSPQSTSWNEFYWTNRLLFQFRLAEKNGYADVSLRKLFSDLEKNIAAIIPDDGEPPALLHGDLWGGNYLCAENDTPVIIDPAVYYGHREADLGMTLLFGGFGDSFYSAYNEAYPLQQGWERRMEIYKLYHLFNHLNLFGEGYYGQVVETIRRLAR